MENIGFVVFTDSVSDKPIADVRAAARLADLPESKIHDHKSRNAFIRAIREMARGHSLKAGDAGTLVDRVIDDENKTTFQFSKKYAESQGVRYDKDAVISLDKESGEITCANTDYKALAARLMDGKKKQYKISDINGFVARVVKAECHKVPLRDAVYFLPMTRGDLVSKLKRFYARLGFVFHVLPVGHTAEQTGNILKAVVRDLRNNVDAVHKEVAKLQKDGALTKRIAKNRLKELRQQAKGFRELAQALKTDLGSLITDAGEATRLLVQVESPVDAFIASVARREVNADPVLLDLLVASEEAPGTLEVHRREEVAAIPEVEQLEHAREAHFVK
jgi:hypothetical protein